jgi:hypothetical protein
MYRFLLLSPVVVAALLAGCASSRAPAPGEPAVSVVNVLSWDNALSGKRDGLRSSWPLHRLRGQVEEFPLTQVKQCQGTVCSWGVLKASRTVRAVQPAAQGVQLDLVLDVNVARSHAQRTGPQEAAVTIPADVPALAAQRHVERKVELAYGKVTRIDFEFGIAYEVCAERLNGEGKPVEACPLPYF